jgi:hypothetical protein
MTLNLTAEEIITRNKAKQNQWRIDHPERVRAFHRKYNSKEEVLERKREWSRANRERINAKRRETYHKRMYGPFESIPESTESTDE